MSDMADDLFEMNELSIAIVGEPMGIALAPANPDRERNGRLIQDARIVQMTDPGLRDRLAQVARSTISDAMPPHQHEALLLDTFTEAALLGSSTEVGRVIESMGDARFCRWLATAKFG
jgi:hypothetical protein